MSERHSALVGVGLTPCDGTQPAGGEPPGKGVGS